MLDSNKLEKGDEVSWNWGGGQPSGRISDIIEDGTTKVTTLTSEKVCTCVKVILLSRSLARGTTSLSLRTS
ncbi:hypothetical protein V8E55_010074 [Tylopilus felleus]